MKRICTWICVLGIGLGFGCQPWPIHCNSHAEERILPNQTIERKWWEKCENWYDDTTTEKFLHVDTLSVDKIFKERSVYLSLKKMQNYYNWHKDVLLVSSHKSLEIDVSKGGWGLLPQAIISKVIKGNKYNVEDTLITIGTAGAGDCRILGDYSPETYLMFDPVFTPFDYGENFDLREVGTLGFVMDDERPFEIKKQGFDYEEYLSNFWEELYMAEDEWSDVVYERGRFAVNFWQAGNIYKIPDNIALSDLQDGLDLDSMKDSLDRIDYELANQKMEEHLARVKSTNIERGTSETKQAPKTFHKENSIGYHYRQKEYQLNGTLRAD